MKAIFLLVTLLGAGCAQSNLEDAQRRWQPQHGREQERKTYTVKRRTPSGVIITYTVTPNYKPEDFKHARTYKVPVRAD
jgi:hypothetical protein